MTIYNLDMLLSRFGTSLLFHVRFYCCFLPAHRFLRRQFRWCLIFPSLEEFSTVCCDLHKGFGIVNKEVNVFLEYLAFSMIQQMLAILSLVSLPFLNPAWTSGSSCFTYLKSGLGNFEHYFSSVWDVCNCAVVWAFFGIPFLWDWNENQHFPVLWPLLSFPNLLAYWVQHFHSIIFQDLK